MGRWGYGARDDEDGSSDKVLLVYTVRTGSYDLMIIIGFLPLTSDIVHPKLV